MEIERVAIIEHVGGHGGMDYYDYGLAYGLAENGISVMYHTCKETNIRKFRNIETIYSFGNIWEARKIKRIFKLFLGYIKAYNSAKNNNVQLIHLHFFDFTIRNLLLILIAKIYPFKIIVTVHDVLSFFNLSIKISEKYTLKLADGVIVHNNASLIDLRNIHEKITNISVIPHGNYLPFINKIVRVKNKSSELRILFFGQIKEVKGLDILLSGLKIAIDNNAEIILTIAGNPNKTEFKKYYNQINELGLTKNITLILRYINDDEIEGLFKGSDLIVLPYKMISQSGVLLLSMSYGIPVLTSDLNAFTEIITDKETGFIFNSENPKSLAKKLLEIYNNRDVLEKITVNSNKLIEDEFDWKKIGEKTKEFYRIILNK